MTLDFRAIGLAVILLVVGGLIGYKYRNCPPGTVTTVQDTQRVVIFDTALVQIMDTITVNDTIVDTVVKVIYERKDSVIYITVRDTEFVFLNECRFSPGWMWGEWYQTQPFGEGDSSSTWMSLSTSVRLPLFSEAGMTRDKVVYVRKPLVLGGYAMGNLLRDEATVSGGVYIGKGNSLLMLGGIYGYGRPLGLEIQFLYLTLPFLKF